MCGCSCGGCLDPLVLPIGPTGPQGPQGLTGAQGPAGNDGNDGASTVVLYNDQDRSTTTSSTIALFAPTKAYSVASGTLSDDDVLELTIIMNTTNFSPFNNVGFDVFFNGSSFTSIVIPLSLYFTSSDLQPYIKVTLEISRVDATTLFVNAAAYYGDSDGVTYFHYHWTERSVTVADTASNNLDIDVRGRTDIGDSHCDQLLVKHFQV